MNIFFNHFSDNYNHLYLENIIEFQNNYKAIYSSNKGYCDFYPTFGVSKNKKCDFLILGQAVNDWRTGFQINDHVGKEKILQSIGLSNQFHNKKNHTPLDWVNVHRDNKTFFENTQDDFSKTLYNGAYRTWKSFFWKTTYKLICDYYGLERTSWEWSKNLVWSNLYKIAPHGGNPNNIEKLMQQIKSIELIKTELEELNPKYCIVLTNLNWWKPFGEGLTTRKLEKDNKLDKIELCEEFNQTKIIVTKRPRFGSGEEHVRQILEFINRD